MTNLNVDRYSTFATTAASSLSCAPTAPFSTRRSSSATGGSTSTAPRPPTFTTSTPRLESSQKSRPPQLPTEVVSPCPSLHQSWTRNRWPIPIWSTCHLWKWPSSPSRPNHPPRPTFRPTQPKPCLTASSPRPRRLPLRVTYPRTIIKVYYNQSSSSSSSQNKKIKKNNIYSRQSIGLEHTCVYYVKPRNKRNTSHEKQFPFSRTSSQIVTSHFLLLSNHLDFVIFPSDKKGESCFLSSSIVSPVSCASATTHPSDTETKKLF